VSLVEKVDMKTLPTYDIPIMYGRINRDITLNDDKVMLRPYRLSDADSLYRAARESLKELMVWMPWAHQEYSKKESRDWLKERPGKWKKGISYDFAIFNAADGSYMGGCGINDIDHAYRKANLGYWVRTSYTGQGVATAVTLLLAKWGFKELKLNRIEIVVATNNKRSLRVAEKAGAKREGILRNRLIVNNSACDAVMHSLIPGEVL
jgi:ribosomal-protein-serine acetyltransferase